VCITLKLSSFPSAGHFVMEYKEKTDWVQKISTKKRSKAIGSGGEKDPQFQNRLRSNNRTKKLRQFPGGKQLIYFSPARVPQKLQGGGGASLANMWKARIERVPGLNK